MFFAVTPLPGIVAQAVWPQEVEAIATAAIAFFTLVAATGAIYAARFAYVSIEENRSFNRTRLTVDLFDTAMTERFANNVNALISSYPSLAVCRAYVQGRLAAPAAVPIEERRMYFDLLGIMGYAGELYTQDAFNKALFLARTYEFIPVAFFVLEPAIANGLRTGLLRPSLVTLARDCLEYRNRIPRSFDERPELQTYNIPENFGT